MDLPNEITLHILEFVSPDDLVNVTLTCSSIYHLATNRLKEHRELQRAYKDIFPNSNRCGTFLKQAYHNPRIWHYVKNLTYDSESFQVGKHVDSVSLDILESLFDSSPYMKYGDRLVTSVKEAIATMKSGSFHYLYNPWNGMFLALLLAYLPNVTTIRFRTSYQDLQLRDSMIETIISANRQNLDLRALRKLSMVAICGPTDMNSLTPLLFLPSLRTFQIRNSYFHVPVEQPVGEQPSQLEEVKASQSDIHRPQFLSVLTNLRKLVYNCKLERFPMANESPDDILACLERYCSGTLEELEFSIDTQLEVMNSPLGTFREFKKLKKLSFPAPLVFRLEKNYDEIDEDQEINRLKALGLGCWFRPSGRRLQFKGVPRLVDILPPSIETVEIIVVGCSKTAVQFFEGLVKLRYERLPNLRSIIILDELPESMDGNLLDDLKTIGASVGIEVKTKDVWKRFRSLRTSA